MLILSPLASNKSDSKHRKRAARPMRYLLLSGFLLAGCGAGHAGNQAERAADEEADRAVKQAVQTSTLTGLYEGGSGPRRSQLCVVERGTGDSRFGLVVWGAGEASCSGVGAAVRDGPVLRLAMEGDAPCTVVGRIEGADVTFAGTVAQGCAYYCGAGASMDGATVVKVGGTAEDAMRGRDLVGDPLCG